jgi:hypothetical protein
MQINRRELLANAAVGTAGIAAPSIIRAQTRGGPPSSRDRLEQALARIADPNGEGKRACLTVYTETARAAADAADARARNGISLGPLDGKIVSIKDLFDVVGEPTRAGSIILANAPPASADAPVVRRLRAAGAVVVAKTNMPEFAQADRLGASRNDPKRSCCPMPLARLASFRLDVRGRDHLAPPNFSVSSAKTENCGRSAFREGSLADQPLKFTIIGGLTTAAGSHHRSGRCASP